MVVIIKDKEKKSDLRIKKKNDLSRLDGQQTAHQNYLKVLDINF